ncbi:hypothetical protein Nmel_011316 [Mimus melanotis]
MADKLSHVGPAYPHCPLPQPPHCSTAVQPVLHVSFWVNTDLLGQAAEVLVFHAAGSCSLKITSKVTEIFNMEFPFL